MELCSPKIKIFQEKFPSSKNKKKTLQNSFLYFGKWNFLGPSLKTFFLYFRRVFLKKEFLYFSISSNSFVF